jgi:hypothetical protein
MKLLKRTLRWLGLRSAPTSPDHRILQDIPGPRIEFGVHKGKALAIIAAHDGATYGVDSFAGMAEPTTADIDPEGTHQYPKGKLAIGKDAAKQRAPHAILIQGFVPEILGSCPQGPFAFAHVDLDQFAPTQAAIEWLWPRMLPGSIILCHDWFEGRDYLAGGAINEIAKTHPLSGTKERYAWWVIT